MAAAAEHDPEMEARVSQLEVYADENMKDHEDRIEELEKIVSDVRANNYMSIPDRIQLIEDAINKIPNGIIDNWTEIEGKMKT